MIIFINGPFGVGKTTVAQQIARDLPNSLLYDPEEIGYMLRHILTPIAWTGDFQDYPMWRPLVLLTAGFLKRHYHRILIIPMTIWRISDFRNMAEGLREIDSCFYHFSLTAPRKLIHERIRRRGGQGSGDWVFGQTAKCVEAFESRLFDPRIETSGMSAAQVADIIMQKVQSSSRAE